MVRKALFKCPRSRKFLYCAEYDNYITFWSGFSDEPDDNITNWIEENNLAKKYPKSDYFDRFVKLHSRTLVKIK